MAEPYLDPEERRLHEAEDAAAAKIAQLPEDRAQRVAVLSQRFDFFAPAVLKIRTKDGGPLWPFVLNPIQEAYLASLREKYAPRPGIDRFRGVRDLIVKPRQLGFSTMIAGLLFMDGFMEPGRITVVLTHKKDLSEELLRTYSLFCEMLPPALREAVKVVADSKYDLEMEFRRAPGDPPSRFIIATERGEPWRGGVIHNLHASEAAWYRDWRGFKASFVQAVPATGNIFYETTVNGFNDYYHAVTAAEAGQSLDRVIFFPWFDHPEYRLVWDPERQAPPTKRADMDPGHEEESEEAVMAKFGLDLEQLAWRRWKISELGPLFFQEYPETLLGAFLTSGRPFFDLVKVQAGHAEAKALPPPKVPRANVAIWEPPIPGELYLLAADVAEGLDRGEATGGDAESGGSDFCNAYVVRVSQLKTVAAIHGRIRPVDFGRMIDRLGRQYEAVAAVERNNHGHTVLAALEASNYPEVYRHIEYNQQGQKFLVPGFPTNITTRPMILDALDEAIRQEALNCPDSGFWREAHSFHRNEKGKPEAMEGHHDDRVMSLAIAVYLCTLGRSGWGVEGVIGADAAGFRRGRVTEGPKPGAPEPEAPPAKRVYQGQVVGEDVLADLFSATQALKADTCESCTEFQAGFCKLHRWRVIPADPACDSYVATTGEDEALDLEDDEEPPFGEEQQWNP